ncbi:hypothetical protein ACIBCN_37575 [Nocardia sp. NPDC051052]|uniref:hypothetical protein n=1 Tax=Nocardia sp. NPDC051052 TaxID=3364322 RepID=UPI00378ACEDC
MNNLVAALLSGLIGLLVSAIGTYLGIQWKVRKDLEAKYDESLRTLRLDAYCELWRKTKPLAAFRDSRPTRDELAQVSEWMMDWYFDVGGLYLSTETREARVALQRTVRAVRASERWSAAADQTIDAETFDHIRVIASTLRTRMTYDVGTRRSFSQQDKQHLTPDLQPAEPNALAANATADERWIVDHWTGRT